MLNQDDRYDVIKLVLSKYHIKERYDTKGSGGTSRKQRYKNGNFHQDIRVVQCELGQSRSSNLPYPQLGSLQKFWKNSLRVCSELR